MSDIATPLWYSVHRLGHSDEYDNTVLSNIYANDTSMPFISFEDSEPEDGDDVAFEVSNFSSDWVQESLVQLQDQKVEAERKQKAETALANQQPVAQEALKIAQEASKHWNSFYLRNQTNFYKDRHYLTKVFPELREALESSSTGQINMLEVGCGVGNAMMPLAAQYRNKLKVHGVDFADSAIKLLHQHPDFETLDCRGYVGDISKEELPNDIPPVDFTLMLFVLSAVAPNRMETAVRNSIATLKPGGYFLFRDYAMLDQAQLRFSPEQRLGYNLYKRQDGTQSFFFTLEGVAWLLERQLGLQCIEARYIHRVVKNNKQGKLMRRVWINCCYQKPFNPV